MSKSPIILRITNSKTFVEGSFAKGDYHSFKEALGYQDPNAIWKGRNSKIKNNWSGIQTTVCYNKKWCKCAVKSDGIHFPTGLASKAIEFFKASGIPYSIKDHRTKVEPREIDLQPCEEFPPYDYQQEIIDNSCNRSRGIIKVATGGGKTRIASGIIEQLGVSPTVFYVTSIDLLKQAKDEIEKFVRLNGLPVEVGSVGGGKKDIKDITVMTIQTAIRSLGHRYSKFDDESSDDKTKLSADDKSDICDFVRGAKLMICDEVQHWAAKTCQVIADNSESAYYRFGLSATPWRDMGDDLLIDACFGRPICDINASFLIDRGVLVRPDIAFVHHHKKITSESYAEAYNEGIAYNEERNLIIGNLANGLVEDNRMVLILVRLIEHGVILEDMIPGSFFIHGSHSGKERENHIELMRDRKAPVTIATSIFDEGVDVKPLDALILGGSGKSQTRALQRVGRVIRKFEDPISGYKKQNAIVIDFEDNMKFMKSHSNKRRKIYESEPEFVVKDFK